MTALFVLLLFRFAAFDAHAQEEAPEPAPGPTLPATAIRWVRVPAGSFLMGSPASEVGRGADEAQVHVTLTRAFDLMLTEVTQQQFAAVMGLNPAQVGSTSGGEACSSYEGVSMVGDDLPVMCVSWDDALEYANALSTQHGLRPAYRREGGGWVWDRSANGYRLPTEAEWEWAARGGTITPWGGSSSSETSACGVGNLADTVARKRFPSWTKWTRCRDGHAGLAPVASFAENGFGLHDMSGNVWEWVWDVYGERLPGGTDPVGVDAGFRRVRRGGCWSNDAQVTRVAYRDYRSPGDRDPYMGLRLVRPVP